MSKDNFPDGKPMLHVEFKDETFKTKSKHRQASSIKPLIAPPGLTPDGAIEW